MNPRAPHLRDRWLSADLAACEELARLIPGPELARFATDGLATFCHALGDVPPAILGVVEVGRGDWRRGHAAFDAVRKLTLAAEDRNDTGTPPHLLLFVGENAARVIYNATDPQDPFDSDSGAWLLATMANLLQGMPPSQRHDLSQVLWSRLADSATAGLP
jgi:hypothetical protein